MASATDKPAPGTALANAVENLPVNQKTQEIGAYLNMRLDTIEEALPSNMKAEGKRLIRRAMIYFASKAELHDCTVPSFLMCVVQAAELGLALDGRLCHAVAYNVKVSRKGDPDKWERRAQCMPDFKGLVSVAKRSNQISDCDGDIVCEGDHFRYGMLNGSNVFEFTPNPDKRGKIRGAFARVVMPNGLWSVEYMNLDQLNAIRQKSKAKDSGPWVTDTEQMYVKTAIRRLLKMYCDDPSFIHATEIDDLSDVIEGQIVTSNNSRSRVRLSAHNDTLAAPPAAVLTAQPSVSPIPTRTTEESHVPAEPRSSRKAREQQQEHASESAPTLPERFAACKTHKEALKLRDDICDPESTAMEDEIAAAGVLYDQWVKDHEGK
jgi:recombination protein RecT